MSPVGRLTLVLWSGLLLACTNPVRCFDENCSTGGSSAGGAGAGGAGLGGAGGEATGGMGAMGGAPQGVSCGDGQAEAGELCDGSDFKGSSCVALNLPPGKLACDGQCVPDAGFCRGSCTGAALDAGEVCDGMNGLTDCTTLLGAGFSGALACSPLCIAVDTSACTLVAESCGNMAVDMPEQCDGSVGVESCESLGFQGGELACRANCTWDFSDCHRCGNSELNPGEPCDGSALGPTTCSTLGFVGGELGCLADCTFDTSACDGCGNAVLNTGEECDAEDFGGLGCDDFGFAGGALNCSESCVLSTSGCF